MSSHPIILIRGILREQRHWGAFSDLIKDTFPNRVVTGLDLAGNGRHFAKTSPNTVARMVESLRSDLQQQIGEQSEPLNLLAISMGGMIALEWMNQYPDEIRSALVLNTSLRGLSPFYQRLRWQRFGGLLRVALGAAEQKESLLFSMTSNQDPPDPEIIAKWIEWRKEYPVSTANAFRQLHAAARYQIGSKPNQPLRLLCSAGDRLVDHHCSQRLADHWDLPIKIHPDAGHDLPLDAPDWVCRQALEFFEE